MAPLDFPEIRTDRLILRAPGAADLSAMLDFFGAERSNFYDGPMPDQDGWQKFAAYCGQWMLRGYGAYAIVRQDTGQTIGLAGPIQPVTFPEPEMSWLLTDAQHEGQGFAFEASRAVLDANFAQHGWSTVVSFIHPDNAPSRALALRLGAQLDPDTPAGVPGCDTYRHFAPGAA